MRHFRAGTAGPSKEVPVGIHESRNDMHSAEVHAGAVCSLFGPFIEYSRDPASLDAHAALETHQRRTAQSTAFLNTISSVWFMIALLSSIVRTLSPKYF